MLPLRAANRLFVALDLPSGLRRSLAALGDELDVRGVRRIPADNLHLTLACLGTVAVDDGPSLRDRLIPALAGPPAHVRVARVVARPTRNRARLAAAELDDVDGALTALATRVAEAVAGVGTRSAPPRPFWPHVTIARFSRPAHLTRSPSVDGEHVFAITRVALYDSHITPSRPPRYEALVDARLDGSHAERSSSHG
jgi:2'-5' RNA ligase